jgi:hypothetical protein
MRCDTDLRAATAALSSRLRLTLMAAIAMTAMSSASVGCLPAASADASATVEPSATASGEALESQKEQQADLLLQAKKSDESRREKNKKPWVHGEKPKIEIWTLHGDDCKVIFDEPASDNPEARSLFTLTREGLKAELNGDLETRAKSMDDNFTIDIIRAKPKSNGETEAKVIAGKEAALAAMKEESEHIALHPPSTIEFFYPVANFFETSGVVNYRCRVIGKGADPRRSYGWVTNVYKKKNNQWIQIHRQARWKVENAKEVR